MNALRGASLSWCGHLFSPVYPSTDVELPAVRRLQGLLRTCWEGMRILYEELQEVLLLLTYTDGPTDVMPNENFFFRFTKTYLVLLVF